MSPSVQHSNQTSPAAPAAEGIQTQTSATVLQPALQPEQPTKVRFCYKLDEPTKQELFALVCAKLREFKITVPKRVMSRIWSSSNHLYMVNFRNNVTRELMLQGYFKGADGNARRLDIRHALDLRIEGRPDFMTAQRPPPDTDIWCSPFESADMGPDADWYHPEDAEPGA